MTSTAQAGPALLLATLATTLPAAAQQQADSDDIVTDEIVVTGTKLASSVQDLDVSVEVFDAGRLDREQIVDLGDLFLKTPNVSGRGGAGGNISIRGIGRTGTGSAGQGVTSNIYVDGAPLSGSGLSRGPSSLWDVAQVEVLRGPQSSVQGRNALAGAIVVRTNDPTFEPEGKLRVTAGSFDTYQVAVAFGGPLVGDQLAGRIALDYQDSEGFIDHVIANRSADRRESVLARAKLLFEPNAAPNLSTKLTLDYSDASLGESRPLVSTGFGVTAPEFREFSYFDYEASGRFPNNDISSYRAISETTYRFNEQWQTRAIVTFEESEVDRLFGVREQFDAFGGLTFNQFDETVFSTDLGFEFDYDNVRGLFGAYYFESEDDLARDIQVRLQPFLPVLDPADSILSLLDGDVGEVENYAVFGQIEWNMSDRWTVNFGFRYDEEEFQQSGVFQDTQVDPESCVATVPGALVGSPEPFVTLPCQILADLQLGGVPDDPLNAASFDAFLPRLSLTYSLTPDSSVFVSVNRGYRAGGSNVFSIPNPDGLGFIRVRDTYEPEFLTTYEIGSRNLFLDGTLVANVNLFYSLYDDQQLRLTGEDPIDPADDRIENAGETTIYGAEFMLDYTPNEQWNLFASVGLLETEFDDFPFAPTGPFQNLAGNEVPNAPNVTATVSVNYSNPNGFFVNGSFSYLSELWSAVDNLDSNNFREAFIAAGLDGDFGATLTEKIDSRTDLTMRVGYETGRYLFYAFGTNLLDEEAVTDANLANVNQATGVVTLNSADTVATVNTPRAFGIGVDVAF